MRDLLRGPCGGGLTDVRPPASPLLGAARCGCLCHASRGKPWTLPSAGRATESPLVISELGHGVGAQAPHHNQPLTRVANPRWVWARSGTAGEEWSKVAALAVGEARERD